MKRRFLSAVVFLAVPGALLTAQERSVEYEVYSAVVRHAVRRVGTEAAPASQGRIVVVAELQIPRGGLRDRHTAPLTELEEATARDFENKAVPGQLTRRFSDIGDYEIVPDAEFRRLPMDPSWSAFYERFPGSVGRVSFSQVGLNESRTQALVLMTHGRGGRHAHATLYLLARTATGWQVTQQVTLAVA